MNSPKYALFNSMRQLILIYMLFKLIPRNRQPFKGKNHRKIDIISYFK